MISLDECRKLLGPTCELSDEELERLRDDLYALADIVVTAFLERREADAMQRATSPQEGGTLPYEE
jgi:hypothetical protein